MYVTGIVLSVQLCAKKTGLFSCTNNVFEMQILHVVAVRATVAAGKNPMKLQERRSPRIKKSGSTGPKWWGGGWLNH